MQIQRQLDYRLYSLGWRSGLHRNISKIQHLLLSIFLLYRRGFAEGSQCIEEYHPGKKFSKKLNESK
ncbi:hypothetical protein JOY44_29060 [Phormidium sp. CLA17]|uniref:hypothetical protein n=1 Tax=Leptolyngbya sp. Cla-17 TaxID=2803751 RepID=UPI001933D3C7|nr:hypothetical protein [Leptolyngbya sp. Cla-17]MBM0745474.1 hypothetical protein [Leptolyngbya sp. Cla-17]